MESQWNGSGGARYARQCDVAVQPTHLVQVSAPCCHCLALALVPAALRASLLAGPAATALLAMLQARVAARRGGCICSFLIAGISAWNSAWPLYTLLQALQAAHRAGRSAATRDRDARPGAAARSDWPCTMPSKGGTLILATSKSSVGLHEGSTRDGARPRPGQEPRSQDGCRVRCPGRAGTVPNPGMAARLRAHWAVPELSPVTPELTRQLGTSALPPSCSEHSAARAASPPVSSPPCGSSIRSVSGRPDPQEVTAVRIDVCQRVQTRCRSHNPP